MARSSFQKLKILYVMDFLLRNSDENHPVSVSRLIEDLSARGISAERKSIYESGQAVRLARSAGSYGAGVWSDFHSGGN